MARRRYQVSIKKILNDYGDKAVQAAWQALKENGETLTVAAKEICPVETGFYKGRHFELKHPGRLRDSIHVEQPKKDVVWVVADATDDKDVCYARIVEFAPYSKPFLRPAYEAKKIEMINHTKDTIRAALRK